MTKTRLVSKSCACVFVCGCVCALFLCGLDTPVCLCLCLLRIIQLSVQRNFKSFYVRNMIVPLLKKETTTSKNRKVRINIATGLKIRRNTPLQQVIFMQETGKGLNLAFHAFFLYCSKWLSTYIHEGLWNIQLKVVKQNISFLCAHINKETILKEMTYIYHFKRNA